MARNQKPAASPIAASATTTGTKRTPRTLSAVEQAIMDEAKTQIEQGKARIKEGKHLGKVLSSINNLSDWGLKHVETAVRARQAALSFAKVNPAPADVPVGGDMP